MAANVIISGYGIVLGFQARVVPEANQLSAFAAQIAPMATLALLSAELQNMQDGGAACAQRLTDQLPDSRPCQDI